jgi:hypothetical protein
MRFLRLFNSENVAKPPFGKRESMEDYSYLPYIIMLTGMHLMFETINGRKKNNF